MNCRDPEPRTTPPEEDYITADCQCEIYEDGIMYEYNGRTWCAGCLEEYINEDWQSFGLSEKLDRLDCEYTVHCNV